MMRVHLIALALLSVLGLGDGTAPCREAPLPATVTLQTQDPLVGIGRSIEATVTLAAPAPVGGTTVTFGSLDPGVADIVPASIVIPDIVVVT